MAHIPARERVDLVNDPIGRTLITRLQHSSTAFEHVHPVELVVAALTSLMNVSIAGS